MTAKDIRAPDGRTVGRLDSSTESLYDSVVRAALQRRQQRPAKLWKVRGCSRGDQIAVHDYRAVFPDRAGVLHVVLDGANARGALALQDPRRDRYPSRVTDERHRLPGLVDLPRELQDLGGPAHLIRCETPRNHKAVESSSLHLLDVHVNRDRVASLPLIRALPQA